ncbi:MAG: hypothetical protein M3T55_10625 [Pseudomonadota bacterium]|nr:hypothetical protein [Pseudomonadota bacterium]
MATEPKTPDHPDFDNNPEWTRADFAEARPTSEVLPGGLQPPGAEVGEGETHVRSGAQAMEPARAISRRILAGKKRATVDDFLASRHREM